MGKKLPKLRKALRGRKSSDSPENPEPDDHRDEEPAEMKPPDFRREAARAMGQSDPDVVELNERAWWETPVESPDDSEP